ncbi:P-loop containing nucleoside triphosphate hydrolase protein [Pluteus cervinus]|uniref:P-loop containing nucleoside triphosphate hydrolase protein n=1 Tax=Pluteus cervinus TaxID=181527 RepID=A0ACD3A4D0_9AGAR|nr:P-loop containing nucleoside triphosphate hydrolase protein [Pluteus cervinus]
MASVLQSVLTTLLTNAEQEDTSESSSNETQSESPSTSGDPSSSSSTNPNATTSPNGALIPKPKKKLALKKPIQLPNNLTGLIKLLFSFGALRDWLKLFVIGGFVESCRRLTGVLYRKIVESFFITASFQEGDDAYDWVMVWLAKRPAWAKAREVEVSTKTFGLSGTNRAVMVPGDEDDAGVTLSGSSKKLAYLPSLASTYSLWHKGHWMRVSRTEKQKTYYSTEETLNLRQILLEAKREYLASQEHTISIYVSDSTNDWRYVASRPKRPLKSIILDPGIKDLLVDDARDFLASKQWYADRGIPFRRGYLLYGAPGSGKTSIIHSMAGELGLDVYIVSLSRAGLDDTGLNELISDLPTRCIALMEDIDAAFHQVLNRGELDGDSDDEDDSAPPPPDAPPTTGARTSRISLSGLLNALDGVGAQEGRILYATTNKYTSLDPALCRPGRLDIHVEFKLASRYQAREMFKGFYLPNHNQEPPAPEKEEKDVSDSGYSTTSKATPADTPNPTSPTASTTDLQVVTEDKEKERPIPTSFFGNSHWTRGPKLTKQEVEDLANKFAEGIPERQLSMASLQGYLMGYKIRPFDAVKDVAPWVEKELIERVKRQERSEARRKRAEEKRKAEEAKKKEEAEKRKAEGKEETTEETKEETKEEVKS